MSTPNLLVHETSLARLGRVPKYTEALWERVHERQGRCVSTSRLFVRNFSRMYEGLGLALVACDAMQGQPPDSLRLRLHAVSLFMLLGNVLHTAETFVQEFYGLDGADPGSVLVDHRVLETLAQVDPPLAQHLKEQRPALLRLHALADEAVDPAHLSFHRPENAPAWVVDPKGVTVNEDGVALQPGSRRRWMALADLATTIVADAANLIEQVARSSQRHLAAGASLRLDLRIEL